MTIVAYDETIDLILADTLYTFSNGRDGFFRSKASFDENAGTFALAGEVFQPAMLVSAFTKWTQDGRGVPFARDCEGFLRRTNGDVLYVCGDKTTINFTDAGSFGPYIACGAGADWYYAFRADGAGHVEAFEKVCLLHTQCGYDNTDREPYSRF